MSELKEEKSKTSSWITRKLKFSTLGIQYLGGSLACYAMAYWDYRSPLGGPGAGGIGRTFDTLRSLFGLYAPEIVLATFATFLLMMAFLHREK